MPTTISKLHLEIFDNTRHEALLRLIPIVSDFTLAGGTALALQLAHRLSYDFDFFTDTKLTQTVAQKILTTIPPHSVETNNEDELTFFDKNQIKHTFLYYTFPTTFPPISTIEGLSLHTIKQIAIHKAYTIGRRPAFRDYFDLYTILQNDLITLPEIINLSTQTYQDMFNSKLFLQQLTFFDDLPDFTISTLDLTTTDYKNQVTSYFTALTQQYLTD